MTMVERWRQQVREGTLQDIYRPRTTLEKELERYKKKLVSCRWKSTFKKKLGRLLTTHEKIEWVRRHRQNVDVRKGVNHGILAHRLLL